MQLNISNQLRVHAYNLPCPNVNLIHKTTRAIAINPSLAILKPVQVDYVQQIKSS